MKKIIISTLMLLFVVAGFSQTNIEQGLNTITAQSMNAQIAFLSSDLLEGRKVDTRGAALAREYIISQLMDLDVKPFFETYTQPFTTSYPNRKTKKTISVNAVNVLGVIEGINTDEYLIIGAHYDHLGMSDKKIDGDNIFNGADDNASGVSAVLQIAKAFKANGQKPEKTIIFAFWDAEEIGLRGSKYFVREFKNLKQIEMYMNFDMIGRNSDENNPNEFIYFYTEAYPQYEKIMKESLTKYNLSTLKPTYKAWDKPVGGSDNTPFAMNNISVIWYHTDLHSDYHKVTDSVEKLNWNKMVNITKSAYLNMVQLAN